MTETSRLKLPLLQASQAQKHVTVNEALFRLDSLAQLYLTTVGEVLAPTSPSDGEVHAVGPNATGEWDGQDGQLAVFINGGWDFCSPQVGWTGWSAASGVRVTFDGVEWVTGVGSMGPNGAGFVHRTVEIEHDVQLGATSTVVAGIGEGSIVYGVTGRVLSDIGGATSIEIGVLGSADRYGSGYGVAQGSWARGITGTPLAYYSNTDLVLTAVGGDFDGTGQIRLAVHFGTLSIPRL